MTRPANRTTNDIITNHNRSLQMYTMVEALVRERMYEQEVSARRARLARELSAGRRSERRLARARAVHERHRARVDSVVSAVAGAGWS